MATVDVTKLIPLQNGGYWKRLSDDGVIMGCGVLQTSWLNLTHHHSEGTDQNVFIKHFPAEYVKFHITDPRKRLRDAGNALFEAGQKLLDNAKGAVSLIPAIPAKPNMPVTPAPTPVTPTPHQGSGKVQIATAGQVTAQVVDPVTVTLIIAGISFFIGSMKALGDYMGAVGDESVQSMLNTDGSLTVVLADYYQGTARRIDHVGWVGLINHKDEVARMSRDLKALESLDKNRSKILAQKKVQVPYIGLRR